MIYSHDAVPHLYLLSCGKTVTDEYTVCTLTEVIEQNILSLHRLDVIRKIIKNIVIDTCIQESDDGRNEQQQSHDQYHES